MFYRIVEHVRHNLGYLLDDLLTQPVGQGGELFAEKAQAAAGGGKGEPQLAEAAKKSWFCSSYLAIFSSLVIDPSRMIAQQIIQIPKESP